MRAAAIGRPWTTARFKRFIARRGTRAEQTAPGHWPIAIMGERLIAATGAQSRTVRLSPDTADKQHEHHKDVAPGDYALVQRILDEGELFHSRNLPRHFVGHITHGGRTWRAVFKISKDERGSFLVSLFPAQERNLKAERRKARPIE